MRVLCYICIVVGVLLSGCEKEIIQTDYRKDYTGWFEFTLVKSTKIMCYDKSSACVNGWKEINFDTTHLISSVETYEADRLKIKFGNADIGYNDFGDTIRQTIYPVIANDGEFDLPEYPIGGFNNFEGSFLGHDTLMINMQYGYGMGGYDIYRVIGVRVR